MTADSAQLIEKGTRCMEMPPELQENLRQLREASGMGLSELARAIKADKGAVSRWERGLGKRIDAEYVYAMSVAFQVSMDRVYRAVVASRALARVDQVQLAKPGRKRKLAPLSAIAS
jgi:transcriptional regulator with XRE-family HTH domain